MNVLLSIILFQFPPPGTFGELQFPRQSTPYACSAGREGRVYYDMDTEIPYFCDDTNWLPFGTTISGTNPFLARFNSAGTNIENSQVQNSGTPAAGAGGDLLDLTVTLNAMDGSDTIKAFEIDLANANHTGVANVLHGLYIDAITGDADAAESAIFIGGSGWDQAIRLDGIGYKLLAVKPVAGTSGSYESIEPTLLAMDGSDITRVLLIGPGNVNHTGASNLLYGISIEQLVPDADATEIALHIDSGWDRSIFFEGNPGVASFFFDGVTDAIFDTTSTNMDYVFKENGTVTANIQDGQEFTHQMGTDLDLSGTTLTIDPNANVVEISGDGADTVSIITPPTATSHTERLTLICSDADVTFIDADAAGAAGSLNLLGTVTGFTCGADDSLTLVYLVAPKAGNARWVEVSRSVN